MTDGVNIWRVSHPRAVEYEVATCRNIFAPENEALISVGKRQDARRFVIVDANVEKYFSEQIEDYFSYHQIDAKVLVFPPGEKNKTVDRYLWVVQELDQFPINRRDEPIIAIGGGVLTDIAGFVASSYRRGIPHIKAPTTLMGYVDASVGIKTGVNFNGHKNRLGSFEPPKKVLLDRSFLKTLPRRHILNGLCEIIKLAVIKDVGLFKLLESQGLACVESRFQNDVSATVLARSVSGMLEELEPNLFEDDLARKVDFGHTFSYGLETHPDTELLHGEAVLIDILISSILASERNILPTPERNRILDLVSGFGFILDDTLVSPELIWATLEERTYHRNGLQRVPLPASLGSCVFVNDVRFAEIQSACKIFTEWKTSNEPVYEY
ncbi:MAG: sedoheptulose 7-phosphate cyclase [Anaerolineales bacterium]|nr:sedoheptulose 7-phosphate cyclase [Anaerolineales bacterium]